MSVSWQDVKDFAFVGSLCVVVVIGSVAVVIYPFLWCWIHMGMLGVPLGVFSSGLALFLLLDAFQGP